MTSRTRLLTLSVIVALSSLMAVTYAIRAKRRAASPVSDSGVVANDATLRSIMKQPHVLFRSTRLGDGYGQVVAVAGTGASSTRYTTAIECERIDMAGGTGVCLGAERGFRTTYWAAVFDARLQPLHRVTLSGIPSRVRVSPDGRRAGITVFVSGHSYTQTGFSTQTTIVDTFTGKTQADLESFQFEMDGKPFKKVDFNLWGVTFASDSNTFYATLGTGGRIYLIRGDARTNKGVVIDEGVECPALSPDNTRIAFKKRTTAGGRLMWRLSILNLATGEKQLIESEARSVDDQVQWLDNERILYAVADDRPGKGGTSIWMADVAGGVASLWADGAYSPAVMAGP